MLLMFWAKYSKQIMASDDLDATRAICVHTILGDARYFSSFYCGKHVAGRVESCTLKSRYIPPFTSTGLADKYAQADASWKHALAHPLIIFRTWNFSAPPQFTWRRNEFSYFSATARPGQRTYHSLYAVIRLHSLAFDSSRSSFLQTRKDNMRKFIADHPMVLWTDKKTQIATAERNGKYDLIC